MSKARSEYETAMQKARYDYDRKKMERLENASFKKKYKVILELLKITAGIKPANIL